MNRSKFFYCYNPRLSAFFTFKGIRYITKAINPETNRVFTLYERDCELSKAIEEYKNYNK